jgi:hypothetical protein
VRDAFGIELPVRTLFEAPTLATLASDVERRRAVGSEGAPPPLTGSPRTAREPVPLSFAQQRLWFLDQLEPRPAYNVPAALALEADLEVSTLEQSLAEIVRRHEALRTAFPPLAATSPT